MTTQTKPRRPTPEGFKTVQEAASLLGRRTQWVCKQIKEGRMRCVGWRGPNKRLPHGALIPNATFDTFAAGGQAK